MSGPSGPRRSRIAHFKAPFILSIAAPAALGLGCGGKTDADGDRFVTGNPPSQVSTTALACVGDAPVPPVTSAPFCDGYDCVNGEWQLLRSVCNPPPPQSTVCPESPAEIGTSCGGYLGGLSCEYDYCYGKTPLRLCNESTALWEYIPPTCNPPNLLVEVCEPTLPVPGSDCTGLEINCSYPGGCEEPSTAVCISGQWLVTYSSGPACNPPAVVPVCPERELVAGEGCAYEGQQCGPPPCGDQTSPRLVCSAGLWRDAPPPSCPPVSVPDDGVPDGGADGGS